MKVALSKSILLLPADWQPHRCGVPSLGWGGGRCLLSPWLCQPPPLGDDRRRLCLGRAVHHPHCNATTTKESEVREREHELSNRAAHLNLRINEPTPSFHSKGGKWAQLLGDDWLAGWHHQVPVSMAVGHWHQGLDPAIHHRCRHRWHAARLHAALAKVRRWPQGPRPNRWVSQTWSCISGQRNVNEWACWMRHGPQVYGWMRPCHTWLTGVISCLITIKPYRHSRT